MIGWWAVRSAMALGGCKRYGACSDTAGQILRQAPLSNIFRGDGGQAPRAAITLTMEHSVLCAPLLLPAIPRGWKILNIFFAGLREAVLAYLLNSGGGLFQTLCRC